MFEYRCNLTSFPALSPFLPPLSSGAVASASALLHQAALLTTSPPLLSSTSYTHVSHIDPSLGAFDTDCSCFITYLLSAASPLHLAQVPPDTSPFVVPPSPRAGSYVGFLEGLGDDAHGDGQNAEAGRWGRIRTLGDARGGDLIGWRVPGSDGAMRDTGHLMIIVEDEEGREDTSSGRTKALRRFNETAWWVHVADASSLRHQWDTRCDESSAASGAGFRIQDAEARAEDVALTARGPLLKKRFSARMPASSRTPWACHYGVGRGWILVSVDEMDRPKAFKFREDATPRYYNIVMGRML